MPDNFITLSNRLLNRAPEVGLILAQQFMNDAWHTMQSKREWSFRRRNNAFAPPTLYNTGFAATNVGIGQPTLVTGTGTAWTPQMVGTQIRVGGLLYPFYTIVGYLSPTALLIDLPWAGADVAAASYDILQCFYPVPEDFGYFYAVVSIKDSYRLWTTVTEADLAIMDPQRTNFGQTYAVAFKDYTSNYGGTIGPVMPLTPGANSPISTTTFGYSYVANASYFLQVVTGGVTGTATFQWLRSGQTSFTGPIITTPTPQNLSDGVQVYWPTGVNYVANAVYVINAQSQITSGVPRYELWPAPTYSAYLYPYIYIAKEYDLTEAQPQLPPFIANRGEVLLEMGLQKCAEYPGADAEHINIYHDLVQAKYHADKVMDMMVDLERNDEEVGVTNVDYQNFPMGPSPWEDGRYQQSHSPFLAW